MAQELGCVGPGRRAQPLSAGERLRSPPLQSAAAACTASRSLARSGASWRHGLLPTSHSNHQENQFPQAIGAMQRMQETRCNKAMTAVPPTMWMVCRMESTILYVVELSSPVDISSMKRARPGVTIISAAAPISGSGGGQFLDILQRN
uniref:Uncharacterized protein n=1 Tax=Oryza punctata TaxID=4537 RepID=A0A0E0M003_ORYPU